MIKTWHVWLKEKKRECRQQDHLFKQILIHISETLNIQKQWNCITTFDHHIEQLHYKKNHRKDQKITLIETEKRTWNCATHLKKQKNNAIHVGWMCSLFYVFCRALYIVAFSQWCTLDPQARIFQAPCCCCAQNHQWLVWNVQIYPYFNDHNFPDFTLQFNIIGWNEFGFIRVELFRLSPKILLAHVLY